MEKGDFKCNVTDRIDMPYTFKFTYALEKEKHCSPI